MSASSSVPAFAGDLHFDEARREAAADDFGHVIRRLPRAVLTAASAEDVAEAIRWAGREGCQLAARGTGHSTFGRSQVRDGIVVDMSSLDAIGKVEGDRITAAAGATWDAVLAQTLERGMAPPVLPNYLRMSVGGTLAAGGIGDTSPAHGAATDNVLELEVVTGTGETIVCSASDHRDLFDATRAGLGQTGVITSATLRLIDVPSTVRRWRLSYPDLRAMLSDARKLAGESRCESIQGAVVAAASGRWSFGLELVDFVEGTAGDGRLFADLSDDAGQRRASTLTYLEHVHRLDALEAALAGQGQWAYPHPWLTTFVGDAGAEAVVAAELAALDSSADLGPMGQVVLSPLRTERLATPLLAVPDEPLCHAFNLIRFPPTDDSDEVRRLLDQNRAILDRVQAAGGVLYPVSAVPATQEEWRRHFGDAYLRIAAAKRAFDPDQVLAPGYELF